MVHALEEGAESEVGPVSICADAIEDFGGVVVEVELHIWMESGGTERKEQLSLVSEFGEFGEFASAIEPLT
jgi:hypothetical protein